MKKTLIVGNWKMYVEEHRNAAALASGLRRKSRSFTGVDVMLAPAFPHIGAVVAALKGSVIKVAAQALSPYGDDAKHTGDVSAVMLKDAGASAVIIGHSERRAAGESDEHIHAEVAQARAVGLTAILCVGEKERDQAGGHFSVIASQLTAALAPKNEPASMPRSASHLVIAYEPVWAIGKSAAEAMRPSDVQETIIFIRRTLAEILDRTAALKVPILYGGSVEGENAAELLHEGGVSGFLVGHASSKLDSFLAILSACKK